jgi:hypothetical protein
MNLLLTLVKCYIFAIGLQTLLHYIVSKNDLNAKAIKWYLKSSLLIILIVMSIIINNT